MSKEAVLGCAVAGAFATAIAFVFLGLTDAGLLLATAILGGLGTFFGLALKESSADNEVKVNVIRAYRRLFSEADVQQRANTMLTHQAEEVRTEAELLLLLQHFGLDGLRNAVGDRCWIKSDDPDRAQEYLAGRFSSQQERFYKTYDLLASVRHQMFIHVGDRSWKTYAGEPILHKPKNYRRAAVQ